MIVVCTTHMATSEFWQRVLSSVSFPPQRVEDASVDFPRVLRGTARLWMILDVATIFVVAVLATLYKLHIESPPNASWFWHSAHIYGRSVWILPAILCWYAMWLIIISRRLELYFPRKIGSFFREQQLSAQACLISGLLLTGALYVIRAPEIPRSIVIATIGMVTITLSLRRLVYRLLLYHGFERGVGTRNVFIVGTGPEAQALRDYLESRRSLGYTFKGFIGLPDDNSSFTVAGDDVVGSFDTLFQCARKKFVDEVFFTARCERWVVEDALKFAQAQNVDLRMVPDMYDGLARNIPIEYLGEFMVIPLYRSQLPEVKLLLKRVFDVVFSSATLIALSPLLLVIAIAIKLDSCGPVFYVSDRIGKKGRVFRCIKFRTMVDDAEKQRAKLMHLNERDGVLFKISNDPRITRLGRFLRKYSLDELPQFFNVFCGDMSIVGPRPPLGSEVHKYKLGHLRRLDVTPGITGLWQVQARQNPSFDSYVSLDVTYIENWSLWLDLMIILRTMGVILAGTGT